MKKKYIFTAKERTFTCVCQSDSSIMTANGWCTVDDVVSGTVIMANGFPHTLMGVYSSPTDARTSKGLLEIKKIRNGK